MGVELRVSRISFVWKMFFMSVMTEGLTMFQNFWKKTG